MGATTRLTRWSHAAGTSLHHLGPRLTERRNLVRAIVDIAAWTVALLIPTILRFEMAVHRISWTSVSELLAVVALTHLGVGWKAGLYRGAYRTASYDEVAVLTCVWGLVAAGLAAVNLMADTNPLPSAAVLSGVFAALAMMLGARLVWRTLCELAQRPEAETGRRMLVFGAGEGGESIIRAMLSDPSCPYVPVALLDDDPAKRHRSIKGVRVYGTRNDILSVSASLRVDVLLIAVPSGSASLIGAVYDAGRAADLEVLILPPTREILGRLTIGDIRQLREADLLGRNEVEIDLDSIIEYITGHRVLVTGAGGSIGSELCRQLYQLAPAELIMLDRDESGLHGVQLSIEGRALLDSPNFVVADIRDRGRIDEVFDTWLPDVVFHAAALKHLPLLEHHPAEGFKTNVAGTRNVVDAALRCGVQRFVNISTDKAADPSSVLGKTKRLAERITTTAAELTDRRFVSVRFGNVLGSRGSVLPTFREQITRGGPVTVTDPRATRFFMTIPEAVRLVLQAGAIGRPGEIMILDMGEPVRILDLAKRLVNHHDPSVQIVITGLRSGEKLHEVLVSSTELAVTREHERILHTAGEAVAAAEVGELALLDWAVPGPRRTLEEDR